MNRYRSSLHCMLLITSLVATEDGLAAQPSTPADMGSVADRTDAARLIYPGAPGPWIAFSGSKTNEFTGFVYGHSERAAESASIAMCEARGGRECEVEFSFELGCAAVVSGAEASTWAIRPSSEREAVNAAKRTCGPDCEVVWSGCTKPLTRRQGG